MSGKEERTNESSGGEETKSMSEDDLLRSDDGILRSARNLLGETPNDLIAALFLTSITGIVVALSVIQSTPFYSLVVAPFVLFVPGYVIVAALYPKASVKDTVETNNDDEAVEVVQTGLSSIERAALSLGVSIAVAAIVRMLLWTATIEAHTTTMLPPIIGVTIVAYVVANRRRLQIPVDDRFIVTGKSIQSVAHMFSANESGRDRVMNVLVVIVLLVLISTTGYVFAVTPHADAVTEFYMVTEQDDGTLVADDYPTEFNVGVPESIVLGVGNYEHQTTEYSLVVEVQDVAIEDDTTNILDSEEVLQRELTLDDGETWEEQVDLTPQMTGEELRLTFMLFKDEPPSDPTVDAAYRYLDLWITVDESQ